MPGAILGTRFRRCKHLRIPPAASGSVQRKPALGRTRSGHCRIRQGPGRPTGVGGGFPTRSGAGCFGGPLAGAAGGCEAARIIVGGRADSTGDAFDLEGSFPRPEEPAQGRGIGGVVEPCLPRAWREEHGHPVVDVREPGGGAGGENGAREQGAALPLPAIPEPRQGEGAPIGEPDVIGGTGAVPLTPPFVEAVRQDPAPAASEGGCEGRPAIHRLRPGVDQRSASRRGGACRDQPPAEGAEPKPAGGGDDRRYRLGGRDVEARAVPGGELGQSELRDEPPTLHAEGEAPAHRPAPSVSRSGAVRDDFRPAAP